MGQYKKTKRKKYPPETELANYVLSEFLDPLGGASKYNGHPIPYNFNEALNHIYSKTGILEHPFSFTKSKLQKHLLQEETHYFRSKRNGIHKVGYGGHDEDVLKLLNKHLGIKKKSYKKYNDVNLNVLLLKFDHDAHNGEKDSSRVQEWLISEYFEDTYKEPSTHLSGDHGYIKVAYPSNLSIEHICNIIKQVFALLNRKRELRGFCSPIDPPCGLPNLITWDDSISVISPMPQISYKEYGSFRRIRKSIIAGEIDESEVLSKRISHSYTYSNINQLLSIPVPCTIKQSQCGKVPRFISRDNPYSTTIDNIVSFYNLQYFPFSHFTSLLDSLSEELGPTSEAQGDLARCHSPNTPRLDTQTIPGMEEEEEEGEGVGAFIVSSPKGEQDDSTEPIEESIESATLKNKEIEHSNTDELLKERYSERIERVKNIDNKAAMTNSFYWHYSDTIGYVPEVEQAEDEYLRLGLNQTPGKGVKNRMQRLEDGRNYVLSIWDESKRGFSLDEWEDVKTDRIEAIYEKVENIDKSWVKDRKRNQVYDVTVEELALVYYAIQKSNNMDQDKKSYRKCSFSYKQAQHCFKLACDKKCHRAKIAKILSILKETGLIRFVGYYEIGRYGNKYEVVA